MADDYFKRNTNESSISRYAQANVPTKDGGEKKQSSMDDTPDANVKSKLKKATNIALDFKKVKIFGIEFLMPSIKKKEINEAAPTGDKAQYGKIEVKETKGGHVFIIDNTPGNKRIIVLHPTGTYTAMTDKGDFTEKATGDMYTIVEKDWKVNICKDRVEVIQGEQRINIKKDSYENIEGKQNVNVGGDKNEKIGGNLTIAVEGDASVSVVGKCDVSAGGKCTVKANKVDIDGGSKTLSGVVTQQCICSFTGKPHSDFSSNVKASK